VDADREKKVEYLREVIEQGSYRVDPKVVADAILRRLHASRETSSERVLVAGELASCVAEADRRWPLDHPTDDGRL
jgi:Anti-sigma-28 factor, FlgM